MLALKAEILCDAVLRAHGEPEASTREKLREAREAVDEAMRLGERIRKTDRIYLGDHLPCTLGQVGLLTGTVGPGESSTQTYRMAVDIRSGCVWRSSHLWARFRVALVHMVGTMRYRTAIEQLEWIVNTLRVRNAIRSAMDPDLAEEYRMPFSRVVETNLNRAREAARRGVMFNTRILLYQLDPDPLPPSGAVVTPADHAIWRRWRRDVFSGLVIPSKRMP